MITIKQGDTRTGLGLVLLTPNGNLVPLAGTKIKVVLTGKNYSICREPDIVVEDQGKILFKFQPGETDVPIILRGEVKVEFPDGSIETYPNSAPFLVQIYKALEGC